MFGLPIETVLVFAAAFIGLPVLAEIILHSRWWKKQSDYYYSFNEHDKKTRE